MRGFNRFPVTRVDMITKLEVTETDDSMHETDRRTAVLKAVEKALCGAEEWSFLEDNSDAGITIHICTRQQAVVESGTA